MTRRMACSMTIPQVHNRTKTVTRRRVDTWTDLGVGDPLTLVEKAMGLPKYGRQVVLAEVIVVDIRVEPITAITVEDLAREGFPDWTVEEFVRWWAKSHGELRIGLGDAWPELYASIDCRRIEWRYL